MAVSLQKGGNISLAKAAQSSGSFAPLTKISVGLGWDERVTAGSEFDLDACAFLLNASSKVRGDHDFIFYNQLRSSCGSVEHQGDNLTGQGDGDDEVVEVQLTTLPADVAKIAFTVTIHEAPERAQNFGMVTNAFIRIVNMQDGIEIARYDLSEDASVETAMIFAEVYRHNGDWKFRAIGQGFTGGLGPLARNYGVNV